METTSTPPATKPPSIRLDFLDGLRALAALWVMVGHARLFILGWDALYSVSGIFTNGLLYMHLAVDIFLVLSGFCLGLPIVRNGDRMRESVPLYFKKRALRILPPYYGTLILILLVNTFVPLATWGRHPAGLTPTIPTAALWANGLLLQDILPQYNIINGPFWSISIEWHIYFFLPIIVWGLRRFGPIAPLLGCAVAGVLLTWYSHTYPLTSPWYIGLFGMGFVAAWFSFGEKATVQNHTYRRLAQSLVFVFAITLLGLLWRYQINTFKEVARFENHLYLIDPICGGLTAAGLTYLSLAKSDNLLRKSLEWRPLVTLGGFSYSLYLIHIPILAALYQFMVVRGWVQASPKWTFAALSIGGGGICILLAWCFSQVIEKPFIKTKAKSAG